MKILILSQFFSTTKGGGEYVFSLMAKKLANNDNKVWIITNQIKGETYPVHQNIEIIFVPPLLEYKGGLPSGFIDNLRFTLNAISKGLSLIKKEHIDIIHSNNFSPALAGSILSSITSKPHVTTIHDVFSLCGRNYWKIWGEQSNISKINVILAPLFEKLMIRLRYDCIHTVSDASKDDLVKFGAKKPIYVIPNSISERERVEVNTDPFQFVYVGRLVFYKNLEVVIRAINLAKKIEPRIRLLIVGDGPHRKSLEKMIKNLNVESNVEFKGYISAEEKTRIISQSSALVFPSLCEGFGLVILEAFSQEKPVLVSNIRPLSDIVSNNITGFVLSPHDEQEWSKCMIEIIKNPQNSSQIGLKGKQVLKENYIVEKMINRISVMYDEILKNNPA